MNEIAHVSLNVSDLARAVDFYRALFGIEPAKHFKDYAKFELREPPLVLSLEPLFHRSSDSFNHMGLRLGDVDAVKSAEARLKAAGLISDGAEDVECCYSRQTKFWLADPDRNLWEVYALTGEIAHRGSLTSSDALAARDRAGVFASWEHKLGDALQVPPLPSSVSQARLRGTFNQPISDEICRTFVADVARILEPGGEILVHGLCADRPLAGPFPRLPGPAALVRHAPTVEEVLGALREAGFSGFYLHKLGERHNFEHEGVRMRELLVVAWKAPADGAPATVVYKGPFARVFDDEGHEFRAGERVRVDGATAARLMRGPMADCFAVLAE
jgi:catechol 2,3-dioxygenase-like lactoylglutathione lyase family enzyme